MNKTPVKIGYYVLHLIDMASVGRVRMFKRPAGPSSRFHPVPRLPSMIPLQPPEEHGPDSARVLHVSSALEIVRMAPWIFAYFNKGLAGAKALCQQLSTKLRTNLLDFLLNGDSLTRTLNVLVPIFPWLGEQRILRARYSLLGARRVFVWDASGSAGRQC